MNEVLNSCEWLCEVLKEKYCGSYKGELHCKINTGKKFYKIVCFQAAHAFVHKTTGDMYKAATWAIPAKGVRCNILKDVELLHEKAEYTGGYLYR